MFGLIVFALDLSPWNFWLIGAAGLAGSFLVLVLGRTVFAGRRPEPRPAAAPGPEAPAVDPLAVDPFLEGSADERRSSLRRRGRHVRVLVSNAEASTTPQEGWILDRSTGGVCLAMPHEMPVGKILSIRSSEAPITIMWVQVEVRYCREGPDGWEVGGAFVKTPPWSVLLHFG